MIRELRLCDVPACIQIVRDNWSDVVAKKAEIEMRHAFETNMEWPPIYYVYDHNGEVVAFAGMICSWVYTGIYDFIWINVRRDYVRQDVGTQLTRYRIEEVRRRGGKAIRLMTKNYGFFKRFGFTVDRVYATQEPSEDVWIHMSLQLGDLSLED